jgi:hypothetical protein
MKIAINGISAQTEHDYRYINKLIECFGNLAPDKIFVLMGRRGQEDFYIPPPKNFQYKFCKLRLPIAENDGVWINGFVDNVLNDFGCDLLLDFGSKAVIDIEIPRVSLISSLESPDSGRGKNRSAVTRKRLTLVSKKAVKNMEKSRDMIFPSRYLHGEISLKGKTKRKKETLNFRRKPAVERSPDRKVLSRYGIKNRYFLSPVSSDSMIEFSRMLKAYDLAFKHDYSIPYLVLVGTDESPAQVGEIMNAINKSAADSKIFYVGSIPDEDYVALQAGSHALVISAEIFDVEEILISAMNSGCAIVCVNGSICREITDGASLYFDSRNWRDLAFKLRLISEDQDLVDFLRLQARARSDRFSWENTTRRMLNFFSDIIAERKNVVEMAALKD